MENINWSKVRVQLCMPGYRYFDTTEKEHYEKTLWNISVVLINQSLLNLQRLFSLTFSTETDRQVWLNQRNMFKKNPFFFAIWHFMGRFGCFMHEEGSLSRKLGILLNLHKAASSLRELRGAAMNRLRTIFSPKTVWWVQVRKIRGLWKDRL